MRSAKILALVVVDKAKPTMPFNVMVSVSIMFVRLEESQQALLFVL